MRLGLHILTILRKFIGKQYYLIYSFESKKKIFFVF